MIEIIDTKQSEVTDQEVAEAVNAIKRYCDGRFCHECIIEEICGEYFNQSNYDPEDWLEVEVPHE